MKTLSKFLENLNGTNIGVSNHYTPIDNIIINVRNMYGSVLGILVEKGEDGVSLKLKSSLFVNEDTMHNMLNRVFCGTSLKNYIYSQGLTGMKAIYTGQDYVAWFYPEDIAGVGQPTCAACPEMEKACCHEAEMFNFDNIVKESEEELEDRSHDELVEIIDSTDKIKAAQQFADILSKRMELPNNIYVKATKDADGNESIALRYKYEKPRPFGKKKEEVISLMNIYHSGHDAIWVEAFLNKDIWDNDIITLINNILEIVGATETKDPAIWEIDTEVEDDNEEGNENTEGDETSEETADDNSEEKKDEETK